MSLNSSFDDVASEMPTSLADEPQRTVGSDLVRGSLLVAILLSAAISALFFACALPISLSPPPLAASATRQPEACPSPLPDLDPINADSDYWPTMRTTLRLCPAHAPSTVMLAAGSRWLTEPVAAMRRHAWSTDRSKQTVAAEHNQLPTALMQGVGYGEPAWAPDEWQVDWNVRKRQQRASIEQGQPPSNHSDVQALASASQPAQLLAHLSHTVAAFDTDPPHLRAFLDRIASYNYHSDYNRDWIRWKAATAPWYEIQLGDSAPANAHRLLFWEIEWVVGEHGVKAGEVRTTSVGDGLSTMVVVYEGRQHQPLRSEEFLRAPVDVALAVLNGTFSCRYEAEIDLDVLHKRQAEGESVDVAALEEVLRKLNAFTTDAVLVPVYVGFIWQDSHYRLHCPSFPEAFTAQYVLDQHRHGPVLRVTALQFSFKQESHALLYGFHTVSLPLCYTRIRHVQATVVLGGVLHGPPVLVSAERMHDWLNHYIFLGFQNIQVPDRFGSLLPSLLPYILQGLADWTRIPFLTPFHNPYMDQHLVVNYYLYHHRHRADWALALDVDELLTFSHPYFSHNPRVVRPPHDSCWERGAAWQAWNDSSNGTARTTASGAQLCRSIVSEYLTLVTDTSPLIRDMSLHSVPMWGLQPETAHRFTVHDHSTATWRSHFTALLPTPPDGSPLELYFYHRWNLSLLTFAAQQLTHSQLTYQHVGDIFPYRAKGADQRPKPFFQPLYASNAHQHGVFYADRANETEQQLVVQLSQGRDMWGFLPDAGSAAGVAHAMDRVKLEQPGHPSLDLYQLLCTHDGDAARWRFSETACCDAHRGNATLVCFLSQAPTPANPTHASDSSADLSLRPAQFSAFDLAILTPLFPLLSQTRDHYQRLVYPQHIANATLALYAPHISHYQCANRAASDWSQCSSYGFNIFPGLASDVKQSADRELAEDASLTLLRRVRMEWMRGREWNYHRDHLMYWDRWRAAELGQAYSTC